MPNRDRTGPRGEGPATGRGMGNCIPIEKKLEDLRRDEKDCGVGRGLPPCGPRGMGRGRGRGMGRGRNADNFSTEKQLENLRQRVKNLEEQK